MAHAWRDEDLDKARDLATELGRHTGSHKWLALCGYVLNLTRDLKEIREERDELRERWADQIWEEWEERRVRWTDE